MLVILLSIVFIVVVITVTTWVLMEGGVILRRITYTIYSIVCVAEIIILG